MSGQSLWRLAEHRAAAAPGAQMLVDENGRQVTFGEFRDKAERVSAGLRAAGVETGTAVTWQLPTTAEALVLAAALARLGAVQNPVIPGYGPRNLEFAVRQTGAALLIATDSWSGHDLGAQARDVASRIPGLRLLVLGGSTGLPESDDVPPPAGGDGDRERWVF